MIVSGTASEPGPVILGNTSSVSLITGTGISNTSINEPQTSSQTASENLSQDKIKEACTSVGSVCASSTSKPNKLPRNWRSAVDPSNGATYYYHAVTRQTQWDFPTTDNPNDYSSSSEEESDADDIQIDDLQTEGAATIDNIYDLSDAALDEKDSQRKTCQTSEEGAEEDTFTAELFSSHSIHTPPEPFDQIVSAGPQLQNLTNSQSATAQPNTSFSIASLQIFQQLKDSHANKVPKHSTVSFEINAAVW